MSFFSSKVIAVLYGRTENCNLLVNVRNDRSAHSQSLSSKSDWLIRSCEHSIQVHKLETIKDYHNHLPGVQLVGAHRQRNGPQKKVVDR